ncbi:MAG TPA: 50S ribosomal protein L11 methyltransferase [Allosphingosinicella sp.]
MSDDIAARYPQVAGKPVAMAILAGALLARGKAEEAFALASAAVDLAPDNMQVRDLVRFRLAAGVSPWHVRMLNDEPRNRCYAQAIERAVAPGMLVLEIGSGAGLLALIAARAGARVFTCEADPVVAAAATRIAAQNGFADRITVIPKSSVNLRVGEDLPGPADLLVSELFDDTLFGENIVAILSDAKRLLKPGAPVLPRFSELRCALVEQPPGPFQRPLGAVHGFDLSAFNLLAPARALRVSRRTAVVRSEPVAALAMDYEAAPFGPIRQIVPLQALGGRVDAFAQWIRIDFGGGIVLENNPFEASQSHWAAPLYPFPRPIETAAGERIEMEAHLMGDRLTLSLGRRTLP